MFGDIVRAHRRRLGLTQEELAEKTGVSVRNIGKIEANQITSPRPATMRLLADAFGLVGADRERFCQSAADELVTRSSTRRPPAQLPLDVYAFTGRADQLSLLDSWLGEPSDQPAGVVISTVSGTAGVGKTALAVRWAHRVADRFPDGQLYVNLRGYDPDQPVAPADALARFLVALGVVGPELPVDLDDRAARYRSEVAGRRMLIVLDNAATVEQVRPLLPGSGSCAVVVTSRDSLAGLIAVHGARRLDLDLLTSTESVDLLRRLIGARADVEPEATASLAAQCALLPLALRVAAELASSRPATPLADLVAELADHQRRLELLDGGDPHAAVAEVFSWSYQHLPPSAARMFRLLGLHPGDSVDPYAAAALAGSTVREARHALELLARAHLIDLGGSGRYGMHDLMRAYALRLATVEELREERGTALARLFDYYLGTAATAMDRIHPADSARRPRPPVPATQLPDLPGADSARAWLAAELPSLVAVAAYATSQGHHTHTVRLSAILYRHLEGGHYPEALAMHGAAHDAARRAGDLAGQGNTLRYLGDVIGRMGDHSAAAEHHERALALLRRAGDRIGEAAALNSLGNIEAQLLGRFELAAARYAEGLAVFREIGEPLGEAMTLTNLGIVERRLGRYAEAADHHRQALARFRELDDPRGEASALTNLGTVEQHLGHFAQAAECHGEALTLFQQLGNLAGEASVRDSLGVVHLRLGRPEQAVEHLEHALSIQRRIGDRHGEAQALNTLGEAAYAMGLFSDAHAHHGTALAVASDVEARAEEARAHAGLGHACARTGDHARARTHYERALALFTGLGLPEAGDMAAHLAGLVPAPRPATA